MHAPAPPAVHIRTFNPQRDAAWLHSLWHRALDPRWAIPRTAIVETIRHARILLIAQLDGHPIGFCAADFHQQQAALTLLLVEPAHQRRGIGSHLLTQAEYLLRANSVTTLTLGAGSGEYFWPGIPQEQTAAINFFRHRGFIEDEPVEDLIRTLDNFQPPAWVSDRLTAANAVISLATPARHAAIATFEQLNFPDWAPHIVGEMQLGDYASIVVATSAEGEVLGTIIVKEEPAIPWDSLTPVKTGTLNTLGVAPHHQGKGIGLALTAAAMAHLQRRGCTQCLIQWTGLAPWYSKLGTVLWARYLMAAKPL